MWWHYGKGSSPAGCGPLTRIGWVDKAGLHRVGFAGSLDGYLDEIEQWIGWESQQGPALRVGSVVGDKFNAGKSWQLLRQHITEP